MTLSTDVRLRDVSPSAFGIESATKYEVAAEHQFVFAVGESQTLELSGRVKRCESATLPEPMRFIVGLECVWRDPNQRAKSEPLIRKLVRGVV